MKMGESKENFAWISKLECPPSICNDLVKKILCTGMIGFMWDDIANAIVPAEKALIIRKNILLHKLRNEKPDKVIQCIKNISQLKSKRNETNDEIFKLEKEYEQKDFVVRRKVCYIRNIESMRSLIKTKQDLLKMKHSQTSTQIHDCDDMVLVCRQLMPRSCKDLDPKKLRDLLSVVATLCCGANKKDVFNTVSSTLCDIELPTLWLHLYQNLSEDLDKLINLETEKVKVTKPQEENIHVGIAKLCGQHVCAFARRLCCEDKINKYQQSILEYIEKIETDSNNSPDVIEWLALALEIRKLETEQTILQNEIDKIQDDLQENHTLHFDLSQLTLEIDSVNIETKGYVCDVQHSIILLKSATKCIMKIREKFLLELQKILAVKNCEYDSTCLKNDLVTEVEIFNNSLDLNALRKVLIKGNGTYRHVKSCLSEASVSITSSQSSNIMLYFPMIQTPIYSLIECYKNLTLLSAYQKFEDLEDEENSDIFQIPMLKYENNNNCTILEQLNTFKFMCDKTKAEIDEFNVILNAWANQSVKKAMSIIEKTVDDVSFPDWVDRFSLLIYMIENAE